MGDRTCSGRGPPHTHRPSQLPPWGSPPSQQEPGARRCPRAGTPEPQGFPFAKWGPGRPQREDKDQMQWPQGPPAVLPSFPPSPSRRLGWRSGSAPLLPSSETFPPVPGSLECSSVSFLGNWKPADSSGRPLSHCRRICNKTTSCSPPTGQQQGTGAPGYVHLTDEKNEAR